MYNPWEQNKTENNWSVKFSGTDKLVLAKEASSVSILFEYSDNLGKYDKCMVCLKITHWNVNYVISDGSVYGYVRHVCQSI